MTTERHQQQLVLLTLAVFWGSVLFGLLMPWLSSIIVDMIKHGQSFDHAMHQLRLYLFAPGYNLFLVAVLNAVPFVLFAVFALWHLGLIPTGACQLAKRRAGGILAALLTGIGLSGWTHLSTLLYPDAQGALAYLFLPFALVIAFPASYLVGRLAGHWLFR